MWAKKRGIEQYFYIVGIWEMNVIDNEKGDDTSRNKDCLSK